MTVYNIDYVLWLQFDNSSNTDAYAIWSLLSKSQIFAG